jgi:RHS repeat-associated protein
LQYGVGSVEQIYGYDDENRLTQVTLTGDNVKSYGYDSRNQRILRSTSTSFYCSLTVNLDLYGVDGKKLEEVSVATANYSGTCGVESTSVLQTNVWFGGRLLVPHDRLSSNGKYFPYGEDRTNPNPANPSNGVEKFATYTRDSSTGLDYADQRYYTSGLGRFLTADRRTDSATPTTPQSWNRYSYGEGDPTNANDPTGSVSCLIYTDYAGTMFYPDYVEQTLGFGTEVSSLSSICDDDGSASNRGSGGGGGGNPITAWKASFYTQFGALFNKCIQKVFGASAAKIPTQTISNAPILNVSLDAAGVGALCGSGEAEGCNSPNSGTYGTVYIDSADYWDAANYPGVNLRAGTYAHELANILNDKLNGSEYTFGNAANAPNGDPDTGEQVEQCMFGQPQYLPPPPASSKGQ